MGKEMVRSGSRSRGKALVKAVSTLALGCRSIEACRGTGLPAICLLLAGMYF